MRAQIKVIKIDLIKKDLKSVPHFVLKKLRKWISDVEIDGLDEVRKIPGWRDHALKGSRQGQRAIYLNKQWRVVYTLEGCKIKFVNVLEIHPHEY